MGIWILMLLVGFLLPLIMIGCGTLCDKRPPKKINNYYGYRTTMSMRNEDTWEFAHHHWGKTAKIFGRIMLVVSIVTMLFVLGTNEETIAVVGFILITVQTVGIIGTIIPTEKALKETFDEEGNRK